MSKATIFNIITFILAIGTMVVAFLSMNKILDTWISLVLLILTVIFYFISKHYNKENMELSEKEKEILKKL